MYIRNETSIRLEMHGNTVPGRGFYKDLNFLLLLSLYFVSASSDQYRDICGGSNTISKEPNRQVIGEVYQKNVLGFINV